MSKIPCFKHKEYKKGCKECFEMNTFDSLDDNGDWIHDLDMGDR